MSDDIEDRIAEITWDGTYSSVLNGCGEEIIVIFKSLSLKQKNFVSFIYEKAKNDAISKGVITRFEMKTLLKERQIWTPHDDETIELARKKIASLLEIQKKLKKTSREHKRYALIIAGHLKAFNELREKCRDLFSPTAEAYSEEIRTLALIYCLTYDENENKMWTSWPKFFNGNDKKLISNLLTALGNNVSRIDIKDIRKIARSPQWRFRWSAAKKNIAILFDKTIGDFNLDQQNLLYWSQVYDSVYESYEPPPDDVIENDDKLDKWFEEKGRAAKAKDVESGKPHGKIKLSERMRRHGEIFIMANPEIYSDAPTTQEIEALNSPVVRKFKKKELEHIQKKGVVNEKELRSRKNKISRRIIGSTDAVIGKNSMGQARGGRAAGKQFPGGTIG